MKANMKGKKMKSLSESRLKACKWAENNKKVQEFGLHESRNPTKAGKLTSPFTIPSID